MAAFQEGEFQSFFPHQKWKLVFNAGPSKDFSNLKCIFSFVLRCCNHTAVAHWIPTTEYMGIMISFICCFSSQCFCNCCCSSLYPWRCHYCCLSFIGVHRHSCYHCSIVKERAHFFCCFLCRRLKMSRLGWPMSLWITNLPCPNGTIAQSLQAQLKEKENGFHLRLKAEATTIAWWICWVLEKSHSQNGKSRQFRTCSCYEKVEEYHDRVVDIICIVESRWWNYWLAWSILESAEALKQKQQHILDGIKIREMRELILTKEIPIAELESNKLEPTEALKRNKKRTRRC